MKAIALLSGGLDSTLAIRLVLAQGIDIEALNCMSPFCLCSGKSGCGSRARRVADDLGITLRHVNIAEQFIERVKSPQYSYGKRLNPCIDCRILMHRAAKRCMESAGAAFIVTGEVLGQRPKSQYRAALALIEKKSGLEGLVLRPLSAKLLPPSIPERKGWVDQVQAPRDQRTLSTTADGARGRIQHDGLPMPGWRLPPDGSRVQREDEGSNGACRGDARQYPIAQDR